MNADIYKELPEEVYNKYNGVKREAYPAATIGVTNMTVTFSSPVNSQDVYEVIDRIADDEKTIILNTVSTEVVTAGESEKVESSVNLTLYSIYPLNVEKVLEETDEVKPLETQPAA